MPRDFDDAISLEREEGRWRLWVHIADVSHFVQPGRPIDEEAKNRATSVYLPDRVIPMIPEIISNHLASLQPQKMRLVKTAEIEMLDDLTITHTQVHNAVIHSDMRLNYDQVDQFLATPDPFREKWGEPICDLLTEMHQLAMQIRRDRFKHGALLHGHARHQVGSGQGGQGQRGYPDPPHREPSDHRRVHARRQSGGRHLAR